MSLHEELVSRQHKLSKLREKGIEAYADRFEKNADAAEAASGVQNLPDLAAIKENLSPRFFLAGRIMTLREHGKIIFAHIKDQSGQVQIAFSKDISGDSFELISLLDRGDWIGVSGDFFTTKKGEKTLLVKSWKLLSKALRPLPEKWHGLKDQEIKYRKRYLDLVMNSDTRDRFRLRTRIIGHLRDYLNKSGFEEVETPVLGSAASGALAKPFVTHHQALDTDFYLRIAPETYLKRLIVGGYEKVFEFAKCFRNEGIDPSHLQEFTMLEYYAALWNWQDNMAFTEKLVADLVRSVFASASIKIFGTDIDFTPPYPQVTLRDLVKQHAGIDIDRFPDAKSLRQEITARGIDIENIERLGRGNLIDSLYKKTARPHLVQPTFLIAHPLDLSPLARRNDKDPDTADRFQLVVHGWEIVNAYSELIDPLDQRERLLEQAELKAQGDEEAMMMDEDYLEAMEYGMPPVSGWGMGIDRLVTLVTSQGNLKDCVLFPLLKPEHKPTLPSPTKQEKIIVSGAGIKRSDAWQLVQEYVHNKNLQKHALAVEAVMRAFANKFNDDEEVWGITGLLHDLDYEKTKDDMQKHALLTAEILTKRNVSPVIINAIKAHNYTLRLSLDTMLAKTLYSVEELTGLITACALVQPDKKLSSVSVASVKKKFKQKSFAAGVNREIVKESEKLLGVPLQEVFEIALHAMQKIADDLGL